MDIGSFLELAVGSLYIFVVSLAAFNMLVIKIIIVKYKAEREQVYRHFDYLNPFIVVILLFMSLTDIESPFLKTTGPGYLIYHLVITLVGGWVSLFFIRIIFAHDSIGFDLGGFLLSSIYTISIAYNLYVLIKFLRFCQQYEKT